MRRSVWGRRQRFSPASGVVILLLVLAIAALATSRLHAPSAPLAGRAEAIDGDTLRLGSVRVRLVGLDAPELDQTCGGAGGPWPCGTRARSFVADALAQHSVSCEPVGRDVYGRTLAHCSLAGADLGESIVAAGWAAGDDAYPAQETSARLAGRGVWSGSFTPPAIWRRDHGATGAGLWEWVRSWFQ